MGGTMNVISPLPSGTPPSLPGIATVMLMTVAAVAAVVVVVVVVMVVVVVVVAASNQALPSFGT